MSQIREYKSGIFYRDEFRGNLSWNGNEHNVLLRGEGMGSDGQLKFSEVGMALGADDVKDARGMAIADFDNDGDFDMVININPGDCGTPGAPPVLLRNEVGQSRKWIAVKLIGTRGNRDAIGAQVTVRLRNETGKHLQMLRHVSAGGGYASQNSDRLYFGLGDNDVVDLLTVVWPGGKIQNFYNIPSQQFLQISEDGELHSRVTSP